MTKRITPICHLKCIFICSSSDVTLNLAAVMHLLVESEAPLLETL